MKKKVRLNMAGALVKFLIQQYIARDGVEHRLINGVFGIFGHGNVTGFGQALEELGGDTLPFYQPKTEQCARLCHHQRQGPSPAPLPWGQERLIF